MTTEADVIISHTIDDDIAFERVRHMPRRTQFVSRHRKLSWQHDRELKKHERDQRLCHVEMSRAQVAMEGKLSRLQDIKKQMLARQTSDPGAGARHDHPRQDHLRQDHLRRCSVPCPPDPTPTTKPVGHGITGARMKHCR